MLTMKSILKILFLHIVILTSCEKREHTNPFDTECPKELWSPTNFKAVQEGTTVKLTWYQPTNHITGFNIQKTVTGSSTTNMPVQSSMVSQVIDNTLIGGKKHSYILTAFAGNNTSNTVFTEITPILTPDIMTTDCSSVTYSCAISGGTINNDGGANIISRGVCWSTTANPTTINSKTSDGIGTGIFTSSLTGLASGTIYYVRAYAANSIGTAYGDEVSFITSSLPLPATDADGNVYQTVIIGTQVWMAENLKTTKYKDGTLIPNITEYSTWNTNTSGAYCWYNNDATSYKATYGALYNWHTINTGKLCPTGWHVPNDYEWTVLINYLGGNYEAANKMRESGTEHWIPPNTGATNASGFLGLPGGMCSVWQDFSDLGNSAIWWSSNERTSNDARYYGLYNSSSTIQGFEISSGNHKNNGLSIRCLKD